MEHQVLNIKGHLWQTNYTTIACHHCIVLSPNTKGYIKLSENMGGVIVIAGVLFYHSTVREALMCKINALTGSTIIYIGEV